MKIDIRNRVVKIERKKLELTGDLILALLRNAGAKVPPDAAVTFTVPRGGDYSGMTVDVDDSDTVTVSWSEESEHEDDKEMTISGELPRGNS